MDIKGEINLILNDFANVFRLAAEFYAGKYLNSKGKDSLSDSELLKNMKVEVKDQRLVISLYRYYVFIESGRKKGAKGVPLDVLIKWIKKNKIVGRDKKGKFISVNSLAFIFQRSIKLKGIAGRPFLKDAYDQTVREFNNKLDGFIDDIAKDALIRFTKK